MSSKTFIISPGSDCVKKIKKKYPQQSEVNTTEREKTVDKEPFIQEIQDLPNTCKDSEFIHGAV